MEKVNQQPAVIALDTLVDSMQVEPRVLSLDDLEQVSGGFDETTDLPGKGW